MKFTLQQIQQTKYQFMSGQMDSLGYSALYQISSSRQFFSTRAIQGVLQTNSLNSYIDRLQQKVERAKWKQNLLLQYNYMPLNSIKEKIQTEKANYQSKVKQFQKRSQKQFQNSDLLEQLQKFRIFSEKLQGTLSQIKASISNAKISNQVLKKQKTQKRERLKAILKQNMELNKVFAETIGVQNKQDLIKLMRSKSQKKYGETNNSNFKISNRNRKSQNEVAKNDGFLFSQCYKLLQQQIKHMRTNQDIQSGIYLQIIPKKYNPFSSLGRYSLKSNICNTLHQRYGKKSTKLIKRTDFNEFDMDWQAFKQLNWKQILGIMIIKDIKYERVKQLMQFQ